MVLCKCAYCSGLIISYILVDRCSIVEGMHEGVLLEVSFVNILMHPAQRVHMPRMVLLFSNGYIVLFLVDCL
jgi:hypothetical protein